MECPDCEIIRPVSFGRNRLILRMPTAGTIEKVKRASLDTGLQGDEVDGMPEALCWILDDDALNSFIIGLAGEIGDQELEGCQALVLPAGREPKMIDYLAARTLRELVARMQSRWLETVLAEHRLVSLLQPILRPDGSVFGHEALARGVEANGALIGAGALFGAAAESNLLFSLDLAARRSAIQTWAKVAPRGQTLFVNFNPSSIYDPAYCLRTTVTAVSELGLTPGNIVFEVTESGEVKNKAHLKGILNFYRKAGFRVALDDVGAGFSGLNMLQEIRPDILKIDMDLMRGIDTDGFRQSIVSHLIALAHEQDILVVAEGLETPQEIAFAQQAGADLLQGFGLARPATTPQV